MVMLIKVHRLYRSTGASFQKAQQEFATGVMRNDNVQSFAGQAAAAGARQAMSTGAGGAGANRY